MEEYLAYARIAQEQHLALWLLHLQPGKENKIKNRPCCYLPTSLAYTSGEFAVVEVCVVCTWCGKLSSQGSGRLGFDLSLPAHMWYGPGHSNAVFPQNTCLIASTHHVSSLLCLSGASRCCMEVDLEDAALCRWPTRHRSLQTLVMLAR